MTSVADKIAEHPFKTAWRTRDIYSWTDALAPDVVAHSPLLKAPFKGRETVAALYRVFFAEFGELRVTDEFGDGHTHAFFWRADVKGRVVEGADLVRSNEAGEVIEIRVLIRPLVDIATFAAATGGPIARQSGRLRGVFARALTTPLKGFLALTDAVATRIVRRR